MAQYESLNYMDSDSLYSDDELMVRQTIRDFVEEEVIPTLQDAHRTEEFPKQLIPRFGEMGVLGSTIEAMGALDWEMWPMGCLCKNWNEVTLESAPSALYKELSLCSPSLPMDLRSKKKNIFLD